MSLTTVQLWQALQDSQIASAAQCRVWASEIVEASGSSALENPHLLLAQLVKLGYLTPFQANALIDNKIATLTIGRHKLLAPLTVPGLQDWFEAIDPSTNAARWLYALSIDRLQTPQLERSPPCLSLARLHVSAMSDGLQSFSPPAILDGYLIIAATPADGRPLRDILKDKPDRRLEPTDAFRLLHRLTVPLAALHEKGLIHGRLAIDQIWWDGKESVTLLRDPLFYPSSPLGPNAPTAVGITDDQDSRVRYAAPEFAAPGQQPTTTTDVYALGCLWWELLTGQIPYADTMIDKVPTAAAKFPLPMPGEGRLTSSQQKLLSHMLAKNPVSRFTDARVLKNAFDIVSGNAVATTEAASLSTAVLPKNADAPAVAPNIEAVPKIDRVVQRADATVAIKSPSSTESPASSSSRQNTQTVHPNIAAQAKSPDKILTTDALKPAIPAALPTPQGTAAKSHVDSQNSPVADSSTPRIPTAANRSDSARSSPDSAVKANSTDASRPEKASVSFTENRKAQPSSPTNAAMPVETNKQIQPAKKVSAAVKEVSSKTGPHGKAAPRRLKKKGGRPVWLMPAVLGSCLTLLSGLVWLLSPKSSTPKNVPPVVSTGSKTSSPSLEPKPSEIKNEIPAPRDPMEDQFVRGKDGEVAPWLPPRASAPYSLSMLPAGAQGFVFVNPQGWRDEGPGAVMQLLLEEELARLWQPIPQVADWKIDELSEVAIAMYGGRTDGWPRLVYRLTFAMPALPQAMKNRLKAPQQEIRINDQHTIYEVGDSGVFFEPQSGGNDQPISTVAIGPLPLVRELAEQDGAAGPLRRQMEQLWQSSDARSDFTVLVATGFLFADARNVLPNASERIFQLGRELFDEKTQALMVATTLAPQWYGELIVVGNNNDEAVAFSKAFRERMKELPNVVEAELASNPASAYWRALSLRFPQMLRSLHRYLRFGTENGQAVSNFYLPATASPNLLVSTWMALKQPRNIDTANATQATTAQAPAGITGQAVLDFPVAISFDQEPLDIALATIAEEVNKALPAGSSTVEVMIDGKAFELAGVTRNQQIRDFKFKNEPLRRLLTDIAARLNPDRTVKELTETKQVVVWVVETAGATAKLRFTTRPAVAAENGSLPREFLASP